MSTEKAPSPEEWFNANNDEPIEKSVNPYESIGGFESDGDSPGNRPGVRLSIRGAKPYDPRQND